MGYKFKGIGEDEKGREWDFSLEITIDNENNIDGEFNFKTSDGNHYGTEIVEGKVNRDDSFIMQGVKLIKSKNLVFSKYEGKFYQNYSKIKGKWSGGGGSPGKFW